MPSKKEFNITVVSENDDLRRNMARSLRKSYVVSESTEQRLVLNYAERAFNDSVIEEIRTMGMPRNLQPEEIVRTIEAAKKKFKKL